MYPSLIKLTGMLTDKRSKITYIHKKELKDIHRKRCKYEFKNVKWQRMGGKGLDGQTAPPPQWTLI